MKRNKASTMILDAALYRADVFNDTSAALVEEIPVEAVSNDYLERAINVPKPCSGRWTRNASSTNAN